jgi:putative PIN family toxin of toxin-antitoxin system
MTKTRVFLDSSVLISALLSTKGGSFYILTQLKNKFIIQINHYVLDETLEVLNRKFPTHTDLINDLFLLLGVGKVKILNNPELSELKSFPKIVDKNDLPILVSAVLTSHYLISLDKDFLEDKVRNFDLLKNIKILSPREFITRIVK